MSTEHAPQSRPYWHVDAKWVTGLLLVFAASLTFLVYNLVLVTAEKPAVDTLSMAMALALSQNGLDDATEIEKMMQQVEASPDRSIQPIPGLRIIVREQDFAGLSPRQARLRFFRQWAEPIYRGGAQGLAALADNPEMKADIVEGGGFLNVLTLETHQGLQRALMVLAVASLVLLAPLVFFSDRFGRIGSPGCVLFVASLPGAGLFGFLSAIDPPGVVTPPAREAGVTALAGYVASFILPQLAQIIARSYFVFLALGLGLMLLAVLSDFAWRTVRRMRQSRV